MGCCSSDTNRVGAAYRPRERFTPPTNGHSPPNGHQLSSPHQGSIHPTRVMQNVNATTNLSTGSVVSPSHGRPDTASSPDIIAGHQRRLVELQKPMIVNGQPQHPGQDGQLRRSPTNTAVATATAMTAAVLAGAPATPSSLSGGYRRLADARSGYVHGVPSSWSRSGHLLQPPSSSPPPPRSTTPPLHVLAAVTGANQLTLSPGRTASLSPGVAHAAMMNNIASPTYIIPPRSPSLRLPSPIARTAGWQTLLPPAESPHAQRALAAAASASVSSLVGGMERKDIWAMEARAVALATSHSHSGGGSSGVMRTSRADSQQSMSSASTSPLPSPIPLLPKARSFFGSRLPVVGSQGSTPPALEGIVLSFLDMGDLVPLTMICGWQRRIVIRYLSSVRHLRVGAHHQFGVPNAQQVALTLIATFCRHLRTLVCVNDSAFCTIASTAPIDPMTSSVTDVLARAHPIMNANHRAATHIRNRLTLITRQNKSTLQSIVLPQLTVRVMNGRIITGLAMCPQLTSLSVLAAPHDNDEQRTTMKAIVLAMRRCGHLERLSLCTSLLYYRRPDRALAHIDSEEVEEDTDDERAVGGSGDVPAGALDDKYPYHHPGVPLRQGGHIDVGMAMRAALLACGNGTRGFTAASGGAATINDDNNSNDRKRLTAPATSSLSSLSPSASPMTVARTISIHGEFVANLRHLCLAGSRVYLSQRTMAEIVGRMYGLVTLELLSMSGTHLFPMSLIHLTRLESLTIYAGNGALQQDDAPLDQPHPRHQPSLPASLVDWYLPDSLRHLTTNTWNEQFPTMIVPMLQSFSGRSISFNQFEAIIYHMRALKHLRFHNVRLTDSKEVADLNTYEWYPTGNNDGGAPHHNGRDGMYALETVSIHCSLSLSLMRCITMYTSMLRYCVILCPRLSIEHVAKIMTLNAPHLEVLSLRLSIHAASNSLVNPPERPYVPLGDQIVCPRLEELTLEVACPHLLRHLVCPSLRSLTLYGNACVLPNASLSMPMLRDLSLTISSQCIEECNIDEILERLPLLAIQPDRFHLNTNDIATTVMELVRLSDIVAAWTQSIMSPTLGALPLPSAPSRRMTLLSSFPIENDLSSLSLFTDELMAVLIRLITWSLTANQSSSVIIPSLPMTTRWDLRNDIAQRLVHHFNDVIGAAATATALSLKDGPRSPRNMETNDQRLLVMLGHATLIDTNTFPMA